MRLICPNCGAQYEVSPEAIPAAGRDVQCSACQHVWFEKGHPPPPPRLLNPQPWEEVPRVEDDEEEADDLADLRMAPPPAPPRPRVDPEVSRILREEAEREARARAEETARLAAAEDVPQDPVDRAVAELAREDAAHRASVPSRPESAPTAPIRTLRPVPPPEEEPEPALAPAPREQPASRVERDLDLNQLNANLRIQADRIGAKAPQIEGARQSGGGFGRGFWGTLLVLVVLAALYAFRPGIVEAVPAAATLLDPYAEMVDAGRLWLDRQIAGLLGAEQPAAAE